MDEDKPTYLYLGDPKRKFILRKGLVSCNGTTVTEEIMERMIKLGEDAKLKSKKINCLNISYEDAIFLRETYRSLYKNENQDRQTE